MDVKPACVMKEEDESPPLLGGPPSDSGDEQANGRQSAAKDSNGAGVRQPRWTEDEYDELLRYALENAPEVEPSWKEFWMEAEGIICIKNQRKASAMQNAFSKYRQDRYRRECRQRCGVIRMPPKEKKEKKPAAPAPAVSASPGRQGPQGAGAKRGPPADAGSDSSSDESLDADEGYDPRALRITPLPAEAAYLLPPPPAPAQAPGGRHPAPRPAAPRPASSSAGPWPVQSPSSSSSQHPSQCSAAGCRPLVHGPHSVVPVLGAHRQAAMALSVPPAMVMLPMPQVHALQQAPAPAAVPLPAAMPLPAPGPARPPQLVNVTIVRSLPDAAAVVPGQPPSAFVRPAKRLKVKVPASGRLDELLGAAAAAARLAPEEPLVALCSARDLAEVTSVEVIEAGETELYAVTQRQLDAFLSYPIL